MDNDPRVGDVISFGASSELFVIEDGREFSTLYPETLKCLYITRLNADGTFGPTIDTSEVILYYPFRKHLPLTHPDCSQNSNKMTEEERTDYQKKIDEQELMIQKRKTDQSFFFLSDLTFHGHMSRIFIWEPPNTLLP